MLPGTSILWVGLRERKRYKWNMNVKELEMLYEKALRPIFGNQFCIIHDSDDFVTIVLDGEHEDFTFTLYGTNHVRLYWCNECFIFDKLRNTLVSSDTYGEIVFEGEIDVQKLPEVIVELVLQLKDSTYISKKETIKGKIPSGYDDIKDYVIQARTSDPLKSTYQLGNIIIEYAV